MSRRSPLAWSEAAGHTGFSLQLLLAQSTDDSAPPVKAGEGCSQTMVDLNSSPRTTALFLDYVQWLLKSPNCFSPHCTKSSRRKKKNLGVSLNAKFSSVRDFMAIINPPPQAYNSGGSLVRLHKHGCHNKARLIWYYIVSDTLNTH